MTCPKTEAEFERWFFNDLIKRTKGSPANDFETVMAGVYGWNGALLQIPMDVPGPGQRLPSDAPFYGLTQQAGADKIPSSRLWIPAAIPQIDENGNEWFTRYIQYVQDKPGGVHGVDFIWSWDYVSGNAYVPICDGGVTPVPPTDLEARVTTLEAENKKQAEDIKKLQEQGSGGVPAKFALRSLANGRFVCNEMNWDQRLVANRPNPGPWEEFELVPID